MNAPFRPDASRTPGSSNRTVPFLAQNGTLSIREQERSCLTEGCGASARRVRDPTPAARPASASRKAGEAGGATAGGGDRSPPVTPYVSPPARAVRSELADNR